MFNSILILTRARSLPNQHQVCNDFTQRCLWTQGEYPGHMMARGQMIAQMLRHRTAIPSHQIELLALEPQQDCRIECATRGRRIFADRQHDHIRAAPSQLVADGVRSVFIYQVTNLAHRAAIVLGSKRRVFNSRKRRPAGDGLRCCSSHAASA